MMILPRAATNVCGVPYHVAPVIDIFSAKKFDVSLNISPFPVKMYSGTVIPAGILIDIENVSILGGALLHSFPDFLRMAVNAAQNEYHRMGIHRDKDGVRVSLFGFGFVGFFCWLVLAISTCSNRKPFHMCSKALLSNSESVDSHLRYSGNCEVHYIYIFILT